MTITQNNGTVYSQSEILALLKKGSISIEEADKLLDKVKAKGNGSTAILKVTEKGCVQFRGIPGISIRFGLSLYPKALEWIFAHKEEIEKFMEANQDNLSWGKSEE